MQEILFPRAELLIQQNRFEEAGKILSQILAEDPNNVLALEMLSEVKLQSDKYDEADDLVDKAIALAPDEDVLFYRKARIALAKDAYDQAEKNLQEAIAMDPDCSAYYSLFAQIKLARKKYQEALDRADQALSLDPEDLLALNVRSTALMKLGRKEESVQAIEGALLEDPNNAYTHANYGMALLEKGDPKKALTHFREALRNDPGNYYAQAGMAEALKARYTVYRIFLKYSFWIGNLTAKYQWMVIGGFYFLTRILNNLSEQNEKLATYLQPLVVLLALVAFSTWIITPISNLFLRLNTYGKHLLTNKEKLSSNFVGISLLTFLIGIAAYFFGAGEVWLPVAVFGFTMMVPLSTMFSPSKYKNSLLIYTIGMFLLGVAAIATSFTTGEIYNVYVPVYMFGFIAFQWIANFLLIRQNNV